MGCVASSPPREPRPDWTAGATLDRQEAPGLADGVAVVAGDAIVVRVSMPNLCRTVVTIPQVVTKRAPGLTETDATTKKVLAYGALIAAGALGYGNDVSLGSPEICTRGNCSSDPTNPTFGSRIAAKARPGPRPDSSLDTEQAEPLIQTSEWEECGVTQLSETTVRVHLSDGTVLEGVADPVGRARVELSLVEANQRLLDDPFALIRIDGRLIGVVDLRGSAPYQRWLRALHPPPVRPSHAPASDGWF